MMKTELEAIQLVRSRVRPVDGRFPHYVLQGASLDRLVEPQGIESLDTVVFTQQASTPSPDRA